MRHWLKQIRERKEMTQEDVGKAIGFTRQYFNMIETGVRGEPLPVDTAKKIAMVLNFDWKLFYEDESMSEFALVNSQNEDSQCKH